MIKQLVSYKNENVSYIKNLYLVGQGATFLLLMANLCSLCVRLSGVSESINRENNPQNNQ